MDVAGILRSKGSAVTTAKPDMTTTEAIALLNERQIGALVVSDDGRTLLGIVSERDVVRGLAERGAGFLSCTLAECMASPVVTCSPSDSDRAVMAMMTDRRFRHLPVIEDGALVGIVSIGDVVKSRLDGILAEADALREYIVRG